MNRAKKDGKKVLKEDFFRRSSLEVAEGLLGKFLAGRIAGKEISFRITETEAYGGPEDLASHASRGETPRNKIMWEEGGVFYIYLVYGVHYMINIVTGKKGYPSAVLIRGVEEAEGPGRVARLFKADKNLNGKKVSPETGLWIEEEEENGGKRKIIIKKTPRIGVDYAGPVWSKKLYRFLIER